MTWGKFVIDGEERDLTHLDPYTIKVKPTTEDAPNYKVLVVINHHTFTRALSEGDPVGRHFSGKDGLDIRCFCDERYLLSKEIPRIVSGEYIRKAYFPDRRHTKAMRNYLVIENLDAHPDRYVVAFNLTAARNADADATMFIVSAHTKAMLPPTRQLDSIKFSTLVSKVVRGEAVIRPPIKR